MCAVGVQPVALVALTPLQYFGECAMLCREFRAVLLKQALQQGMCCPGPITVRSQYLTSLLGGNVSRFVCSAAPGLVCNCTLLEHPLRQPCSCSRALHGSDSSCLVLTDAGGVVCCACLLPSFNLGQRSTLAAPAQEVSTIFWAYKCGALMQVASWRADAVAPLPHARPASCRQPTGNGQAAMALQVVMRR